MVLELDGSEPAPLVWDDVIDVWVNGYVPVLLTELFATSSAPLAELIQLVLCND